MGKQENEDLTELFPLRAGMSESLRPKMLEVWKMLSEELDPYQQRSLDYARTHTDEVRDRLARHVRDLSGRGQVTRITVCAEALEEVFLRSLIANSHEALGRNDLKSFILWYDVASGFGSVTSALQIGQSIARGGADIFAAEEVERWESYYGPSDTITQSTQAFLSYKKSVEKLGEDFRADSSGYLLLDNFISYETGDFRGGSGLRTEVPEFSVAGVKLSCEAYKIVYPVSEGLVT
ncbi:MAG: hypothetical protein Q7R49_04130 [Candidatus Daviesbacteria bacterium]|nr:hypothetical protein [Candidatus Daviesbacteria bacterium]